MEEMGKAALVRRVYVNNSRVQIGVLSPRIKLHYEVQYPPKKSERRSRLIY